jgi:hypothetical protein
MNRREALPSKPPLYPLKIAKKPRFSGCYETERQEVE